VVSRSGGNAGRLAQPPTGAQHRRAFPAIPLLLDLVPELNVRPTPDVPPFEERGLVGIEDTGTAGPLRELTSADIEQQLWALLSPSWLAPRLLERQDLHNPQRVIRLRARLLTLR